MASSNLMAESAMGDPSDIAAELQAELGLNDDQAGQVKTAFSKFAASIEKAHTQQEAAEEPDGQAMMAAVKQAKNTLNQDMQGILTPEQFQQYQQMVDEVMDEIFTTVAELKLMDMQEPLKLTDEQVAQLAPVMGKLTDEQVAQLAPVMGDSIRSIIGIVMENSDKRMGVRQKLQMAKSMKKIKKDTDAQMNTILTPEQQQVLQNYREQQKG
jgi:Spy/CpxP family protein refolding chaperone